jgi:hypothetical protein
VCVWDSEEAVKILDYGILFRDINVVEKVCVVCCMLHNNMLSEMESRESDARAGHGGALEGDGLWLRGNDRQFSVEDNRLLAALWGKRRSHLADHIYYCAKLNKQK